MNEKALVKNAGDKEQVKEADRKERDVERQRINDVQALLATPAFRRFVWRYLEPLDRISAHQSGSWTYFNEGERNMALKMKAEIVSADPNALILMMQENNKEN